LDVERCFSAAGQDSGASQSRSMMKDWMQYLTKLSPTVDFSAVTRALTSLHVDFPRSLPELRNMIPSISISVTQPPQLTTQQPATLKPEDDANSDRPKSLAGDFRNAEPTAVKTVSPANGKSQPDAVQRRLKIQDYGQASRREQQDFAGAMASIQESVETFHRPRAEDQQSEALSVVKSSDQLPSRSVTPDKTATSSITSYIPDAVISTFNTMTTSISQQFSAMLPTSGETAQPASKGSSDSQDIKSASVQKREPVEAAKLKSGTIRRQLVARGSIERQTRGLVLCLRDAKSPVSQLVRLEDLCRHILAYPDCIGIAIKCKALSCLLRLRESHDSAVAERAWEGLALIGYVDPVKGRGIRALCLDGGGTKGLVSISIMKKLEEISQRPIHELFDYVCGVSTGSLIGIMAAVYRVPVSEMEEIYKEFSVQMFERNRLLGAGKLFMSHAYYDTDLWEQILRENIGVKTLLETTRDPKCPKFSAVSTLVNVPRVQNFLFRNYNLPMTRQSHYIGSVNQHVWEAIRASSAAPGYYEECQLGDWVHQDGGLLTNNPTAIAIHECRLLWPSTPLQCVVSIGTGKFEPTSGPEPATKTSLKLKVAKIVESATDTEAVHTVLHDLLPASAYFRFNPYMSEEFMLDEIRTDKWEQMRNDTEMYCRKNALQIERAVEQLLQPKPAYARAVDWLRLKVDKVG
jgi:calcium-independent phospholipase A2-gamma